MCEDVNCIQHSACVGTCEHGSWNLFLVLIVSCWMMWTSVQYYTAVQREQLIKSFAFVRTQMTRDDT